MSDDPVVETKSEPAMMNPFVGSSAMDEKIEADKIEAEKKREADRRAAEAKKAAEKPVVAPVVEPHTHGEAAQRFVNKNAVHSERTVNGGVTTPPVRKERYEHPERKA